MTALKVLIIGGGISGPALAYWLSQIDADVTLVERSPEMRASGQQVDLRQQGIDLVRKMGILQIIKSVLVKEPGTQFVDTSGRTQALFPAAETGTGRQSITSEYEIMRGDMVRILYDLTRKLSNVHHIFDSTVTALTQDDLSNPDGKVHVTFNDGRHDSFDLVVGADGTGSKTRRMMRGPDASDARHRNGGFIGYFSVPSQPQDSRMFTLCVLPGPRMGRIIATRKDTDELTRVYMMTHKDDPGMNAAFKSGKIEDLKAACSSLYDDGGWQTARFMEALETSPEANDLYCTPMEEVRLPEGGWSNGRIVLIGDAAHSGTANGIGTTWGLVGAYLLAGEISKLLKNDSKLSKTEAITQGAKNYEAIFRPYATAGHGGSSKLAGLLFPRSKWGIWILHSFLSFAAWIRIDKLGGWESKIDKWKLPVYSELKLATED